MAENYRAFFEEIKNAPRERISHLKKKSIVVGKMKPAWVLALLQKGVALQSATIIQRGEDVIHATRPTKRKSIDAEWWQKLPEHLEKPDALLLDITKKDALALLFVYEDENGKAKKLAVQINKVLKESGEILNVVRTGGIVSPQGLDGDNYILVSGTPFWKKAKK